MRDTLYNGRLFRTLSVIDEGNWEELRIEYSNSISSQWLAQLMQKPVEVHGKTKLSGWTTSAEMK